MQFLLIGRIYQIHLPENVLDLLLSNEKNTVKYFNTYFGTDQIMDFNTYFRRSDARRVDKEVNKNSKERSGNYIYGEKRSDVN